MGRKQIAIDWERVNDLLKAQCDVTGIAAILGICRDTLYRRCQIDNNVDFQTYSITKKAEGRESLREAMYNIAKSGDKTMMIWLSKQYLGMSEKVEQKNKEEKEIDWSTITDEQLSELERIAENSRAN